MFLGFKYQRINAGSQKCLADTVDQKMLALIKGGSRESIPEFFQSLIRYTSYDLILNPYYFDSSASRYILVTESGQIGP